VEGKIMDGDKKKKQLEHELTQEFQLSPELGNSTSTGKQTSEALGPSETRYRFLMEKMHDILWTSDLNLHITYCSPSIKEVLGFTPNERMRQAPGEIMTPESLAIAMDTLNSELLRDHEVGIEPERTVRLELAYYHKNGSLVWLDNVTSLIRDNSGIPVGIHGVSRDITERKRIEEELRLSEEHYRAVVEDQTEIICRFKADGTFTFVNDVFCRFFGEKQEELVGHSWHPGVVAEDIPMIDKGLRTLSPANPVVVIENRVYSGTRQVRWMQFVNRGFFDAGGRLMEAQSVGRDITERKQAEKALQESEERMRIAAQVACIGTYSYNFLTGESHWSPELKAFWGYKLDEAVVLDNDLLPPLLHPDDRHLFLKGMTDANNPRVDGILELVFRIIRPDGSLRWLRIHGKTFFSGEGKTRIPSRAYGAVIDITERKQLDEALLQSELKFRTLFETAPVGIAIIDRERRVLEFNQSLLRILRIDKDGLLSGLPQARRYIHPDGKEMSLEDIASVRAIRENQPVYNVETGVIIEDGQTIWLQISAAPLGLSSDMAVVVNQDITELKKMEHAIRESEIRLRAIFENSMAGILLTAPDGRIFAANPAACRMFGKTEEEIVTAGQAGVIDRKDPRAAKFGREREEKGYAAGEINHIRADGTHFPAQVSSVVFQTDEGFRTCMVIEDISERKQTEERMRIFSRKLLSVREEEKRHLSAALHHDVGSITVGVMARLHAAEEDLQAHKYKDALASLKESRRLFEKSVKQLKALATELRPPDLDILGLPTALRQHINQITRMIPLKIHLTDTTQGATIPPEIQTVLFRTAQECLNNVITHTRAQHVLVRLSAPKHQLRLSITDDGKGFDPAQVLKPGSHLGLQAMQEMIAGLGGVLNISSTPGKGVKVTVTIPTDRETSEWKGPQ
jgi:PAS domain S-box-containing protein